MVFLLNGIFEDAHDLLQSSYFSSRILVMNPCVGMASYQWYHIRFNLRSFLTHRLNIASVEQPIALFSYRKKEELYSRNSSMGNSSSNFACGLTFKVRNLEKKISVVFWYRKTFFVGNNRRISGFWCRRRSKSYSQGVSQ